MRRFLSYTILLSYLVCTTELHEFLKVGNLISHFAEHKTEDGALSFLDFLHMHYSDDHQHDQRHGEELPFKSHQGQSWTIGSPAVFPASVAYRLIACDFDTSVKMMSYSPLLISAFLEAIWQPPRRA